MKTAKKVLAVVLAVVMLAGILPLSIMAQETQTVEKGLWVAGTKVWDGNYSNTATYWVNDGNGGITQQGATEKNYNVKFEYSTLTLKNVNLSKLYEYYSEEATDYQGNSLGYTLKEAAVIYSNSSYSLKIKLEGKKNTITAKVDDTQTARYKSVAGICAYYKELKPNSSSYNPQYTVYGSIELSEKGKLDINVSKGNKVYSDYENAVCKGFYFISFNIQGNPTITVSDCDVAFYRGQTYNSNTYYTGMYIYNGTIEAMCNNRVFYNVSISDKYVRDPKIVVGGNSETAEKYDKNLTSLSTNPYKYVKITPYSAVSAFFLNTFEDVGSYLIPQYIIFLIEVLMQFPLFFKALINWIIELIIGAL